MTRIAWLGRRLIDKRHSLTQWMAGAFLVMAAACEVSAAQKPNILFIAIDDLNDWVGALDGNAQSYTPNLNRLAARGVNFTRAYTAAPACNPSRTALLTGIAPSTSGVYANSQHFRDSPVLADAVTLPQYFSAHGYLSMARGKIFHSSGSPESWDIQITKLPARPRPEKRPANGIDSFNSLFDWASMDIPKEKMQDWSAAEWAAEQLLNPPDQPLFLACGIFRPHLPWYAPKEYFDRYPLETIRLPELFPGDLEDVPEAGRNLVNVRGDHANVVQTGQWRKAVQAYLASIAFADDCVGVILDGLEKSPIRDNTIVVLWSDHGWHLGEKYMWRKYTLWEESNRVVFMISLPDGQGAGLVCPRTVGLIDIYPTLLSLAGLPAKDDLEGRNLTPLLKNPSAEWPYPAVTTRHQNQHSIRSERWHYIRYQDGSEELYDHFRDPMEWRNLAPLPSSQSVKSELSRWLPTVNREGIPARR